MYQQTSALQLRYFLSFFSFFLSVDDFRDNSVLLVFFSSKYYFLLLSLHISRNIKDNKIYLFFWSTPCLWLPPPISYYFLHCKISSLSIFCQYHHQTFRNIWATLLWCLFKFINFKRRKKNHNKNSFKLIIY